jgi:predicted oxidoreductase
MQTQTIGQSDLESTRLAYGCMRYLSTWNPADVTPEKIAQSHRAIDAAREAGYTLFDHADIYSQGMAETAFGQYLAAHPGFRKQIVIATKCGIRFDGDPTPQSPHRYDFSKEHILWSCDASLKKLQTDYIDIYQLHRPDILMNPTEIAEAFAQLHKQGKVKYFGVSNFLPSFVTLLQKFLPQKLVVNQIEVHLGRLDPFVDGTLDQCIAEKITPLSWSPLAGGFLGDGAEVPAKHPRREAMLKLVQVLDETAQRYSVSRTVIALAWLLKHPSGIIPIVGSSKPEHIREAVKADSVDVNREDWYRLYVAARGQKLP